MGDESILEFIGSCSTYAGYGFLFVVEVENIGVSWRIFRILELKGVHFYSCCWLGMDYLIEVWEF
jgi:hypothetical protein